MLTGGRESPGCVKKASIENVHLDAGMKHLPPLRVFFPFHSSTQALSALCHREKVHSNRKTSDSWTLRWLWRTRSVCLCDELWWSFKHHVCSQRPKKTFYCVVYQVIKPTDFKVSDSKCLRMSQQTNINLFFMFTDRQISSLRYVCYSNEKISEFSCSVWPLPLLPKLTECMSAHTQHAELYFSLTGWSLFHCDLNNA